MTVASLTRTACGWLQLSAQFCGDSLFARAPREEQGHIPLSPA